jgi:hypothetical protein
MVTSDSDHYPERLGQMIIINAPLMFSWAWRIIQRFLSENQRSKVRIYGSEPLEWVPILHDLIGEHQLPKQYGGKNLGTLSKLIIEFRVNIAIEMLI